MVRFPAPGAATTGFPAFIPFDIGMRVGVGRWDDPSCPDCKRKIQKHKGNGGEFPPGYAIDLRVRTRATQEQPQATPPQIKLLLET